MDRRIGIAAVLAVAVIIGASACYVLYNGSERPSIEAVLSGEEHARGLVMSITAEDLESIGASYVDRILYILGHPEFKDHPALVDWRTVSYEPYDMESKVTECLVGVIGMEQELVDAVKAKLTARAPGCGVARH